MDIKSVLQDIQTRLNVPKNQYNAFGKYNYRSCEDILNAVKPLLAEHKALILITDEVIQLGERYYIKASAKFIYGEHEIETFAYAREADKKAGMDSAQVTGSTSSYARKYALNGLLLIDDAKDADTMKPETEKKEEKPETESSIVVGTIDKLYKQTGIVKQGENKGKPWTRYDIEIDGEKYGTFSETIAAEAKALEGKRVCLYYTKSGKYISVVSVRAEDDVPEEETDLEPF
jgi:hypothetical protein